MGHNISHERLRSNLLDAPLGFLANWGDQAQLGVRCAGCGRYCTLAIPALHKRLGDGVRLGQAVRRLRCRVQGCGQPPLEVVAAIGDRAVKLVSRKDRLPA